MREISTAFASLFSVRLICNILLQNEYQCPKTASLLSLVRVSNQGVMPDFKHCHRAVCARDHRFDGLFFTAVRTTGIYCRCVCPAKTPKPGNVSFFRSASEAEERGYRPCLRCRPETAPGSPAWSGTSATVLRAVRLIQQGQFSGSDGSELFHRLGVSGRHLNRLFRQHIGITFGSYLRTSRIQAAKILLESTDLPVTEIAFAAGFGSIRRFNDAFRASYGVSPREIRRGKHQHDRESGLVSLRLGYRPPFSWNYFVRYLGGRIITGVESVDRDSYRRSIVVGGKPWILEVRPEHATHQLMVTFPRELLPEVFRICKKVRDLFDLRCNATAIREKLVLDPRLKQMLHRKVLPRAPGCWDPFELGIRTIIGQQISVKAATTVMGRIVKRLGTPMSHQVSGVTTVFPEPQSFVDGNLDGLGLNNQRIATLRAFAGAVAAEDMFAAGHDSEEIRQRLVAIPGIGPWTAEYIAMRALRNPDAFPSSDLGVLKALGPDASGKQFKPKAAEAAAEAWRPWRAYAVFTLWSSLQG
jgi:AraC family transcriptional regulator of adaptative response / DNA-3-methyladenine glycosylase II